jgi:hypothetical protein
MRACSCSCLPLACRLQGHWFPCTGSSDRMMAFMTALLQPAGWMADGGSPCMAAGSSGGAGAALGHAHWGRPPSSGSSAPPSTGHSFSAAAQGSPARQRPNPALPHQEQQQQQQQRMPATHVMRASQSSFSAGPDGCTATSGGEASRAEDEEKEEADSFPLLWQDQERR